jgi:hypothetical protein
MSKSISYGVVWCERICSDELSVEWFGLRLRQTNGVREILQCVVDLHAHIKSTSWSVHLAHERIV